MLGTEQLHCSLTPCGGSAILSQNEVIRRNSRCENRTEEMTAPPTFTPHIQEAGPASAVALTWDQRESGSSFHEHNITQQTGWKSPQGYRAQIRQETGRDCRTFTLKEFCFLLAKYIYSNTSSLNTRWPCDRFKLTCEDDQDGAEQQVDGSLPPLRHTSHDRRDEDLCRDVELQGEGDEDPKTVQQLHSLVRPDDEGMTEDG